MENFGKTGFTHRSYVRFRFVLYSIMTIVAVGPLLLAAAIGYYSYQDLLQKEEQDQLQWQLDGSIRAIEQMMDSLKTVVLFVARDDRYLELITDGNLQKLMVRLEKQYPFFADLGVIDQLGIQRAYWGPYQLQGANYQSEPWLQEVLKNGIYISRVYTGYRQVPHFAIAVSNLDPLTQKMWVLRATIDAVTLQQFVYTIKTNGSDDLFIVDESGRLQTPSYFFGDTLSEIDVANKLDNQQSLIINEKNIFYIVEKIKSTPWSLVLLKEGYQHHEHWSTFRGKLIFSVCICITASFIIVYTLVKMLTGVIRTVDETQINLMKDAEHTDKLASIGRLAAGVGHEINNPLAIINQKTGFAEDLLLMTSDFEHKEEIVKCLTVIDQSVDRCKTITHRLLGFARRTEIRTEQLQINDVLEEVLQFLENSMLSNKISMELRLQDNLPTVASDRVQLQQIFLNILNNAIDAMGKGGKLSILSHTVAGDIRVVIQDNGSGIEDNVIPHIFEPFYTTKETGQGTGLGLSITYGLIKKLGGDITVRSHPGQGTAFTITLPIHDEDNDVE